jgi:hypothetical protein
LKPHNLDSPQIRHVCLEVYRDSSERQLTAQNSPLKVLGAIAGILALSFAANVANAAASDVCTQNNYPTELARIHGPESCMTFVLQFQCAQCNYSDRGGYDKCLIPWFDGAILSQEWKEALWDKFVTGAPRTADRQWFA